MNDNENNNNDNRSTVTPFRRPGGAPKMELVEQQEKPKDLGQRFQIHLADPDHTVIVVDGFLGVTPTFIAVANEEGAIRFSVPADYYLYAQSIGRVEELNKADGGTTL